MKKTFYTLAASAGLLLSLAASAQVTTSQYDNARTGANVNETILTPQNVNARQFGKLFSYQVDGSVYAQPLYLPGVEIPGKGTHNLVFIATEHNTVYAFAAEGNPSTPLWQVSFINTKAGVTTVPANDVGRPCIWPEVGITSTPVIDIKTGTLYVLVRTKELKGLFQSEYVQRFHALAVTTGVEKFGGPVVIRASSPGNGPGSSQGKVEFDPLRQNPRAALLLANDTVYLTWGSTCDVRPYYGWVMAYDARTLVQKAVLNVSPDAGNAGIWMGDTGPAADKDGNVFVVTGNGRFDAAANGRNYGNSVLKIGLDQQGLIVRDYFTPFNHADLDNDDEDLGSGGPVLLPDQPGRAATTPTSHLLVAGKGGTIYLIDGNRMGKFHADNDDHAVHTLPTKYMGFGAAAAWSSNIYHILSNDILRHYVVERGKLTQKSAALGGTFANPGATPSVSANGSKNGIVWSVEWKGFRATEPSPVLHAYDALNVANELYHSEQNSSRDRMGRTLRFAIPTVANGHVYVGGTKQVDVYGLLPDRK